MNIASLLRNRDWGIYDAKNRFSELLRAAERDGPQTILRHEKPVAVVLSVEEYQRMNRVVKAVRAEMRRQAAVEIAAAASAAGG